MTNGEKSPLDGEILNVGVTIKGDRLIDVNVFRPPKEIAPGNLRDIRYVYGGG